MNAFVLILVVTVAGGGKAGGLTTIEFNSQADCEAAKQVVLESFNRTFRSAYAVCVPKSQQKNG